MNEFCIKPNKNLTNTCFTKQSLLKIVNSYNNNVGFQNKISIKQNATTEELWNALYKKLRHTCPNEYCWLSLDFVKNIDDEVINEYTFKPQKPNGKYTWLSTRDLEKVMKQYEYHYNDFKFVGALPIDFAEIDSDFKNIDFLQLYKKKITKIGFIFNFDPSTMNGSHWVAMFVDLKKHQINYFDSVGICPPPPEIVKLVKSLQRTFSNTHNIKLKYNCNTFAHQSKNSECGVYALYFLINSIKGVDFETITSNIIPDEQMNEYRDLFFNSNY